MIDKKKPMKTIAVVIIGRLQLRDCRPITAGAPHRHPTTFIIAPPAELVNLNGEPGGNLMIRDIYATADYLYTFLIQHGIKFNHHGYPVIPTEFILKETPDEVIPYDHRNACKCAERTVLCHFTKDQRLYPRLDTLEDDVEKLRGFMAVGGFDLSPRREFDGSLQEFNLLLNRMVDAFHAVHGIKILPSFRTGSIDTIHSLSSYPPSSNYLVGTIGCSKRHLKQGDILLRAKLLYARPEKLFIYGPIRPLYQSTLEELGQDYRNFKDFRSSSWPKKEVA